MENIIESLERKNEILFDYLLKRMRAEQDYLKLFIQVMESLEDKAYDPLIMDLEDHLHKREGEYSDVVLLEATRNTEAIN